MRTVTAACLVAAVAVAFSLTSASPCAAAGANEKGLAGVWDGGADDWGRVSLKSIEGGYIGTYTGTFNRQLGSITLDRTADGKYKGRWWESDLKRYGTCVLEVSKDGATVTMTWKALDDRPGADKGGTSTFKRKGD